MSATRESEAEWVRSARGGDREAFDRLAQRHRGDALATALGLLGAREDAQDAVQEALLAAWTRLGTLQDVERFQAWLAGILYRICLDYRRRRARARRLDLAPPAASALPDEAERVVEAALGLPPELRDPLTLFYLQGLSVDELAAVLDLTPSNAKVRLHRARRSLRERLQENPS